MPNAKTIQIFCPTGEPRGIRIAEITTSVIQAVIVPRPLLNEALSRPELRRVGLYFLLGLNEDSGGWQVYIGEADDCGERIRQHAKDETKEFWQLAVAMVSSKLSLTKAHGRILEHWSISEVRRVARYDVVNANTPAKPPTPEAMEAESRDIFETIEVLLNTLGHPIFDRLGATSRVPAAPAESSTPLGEDRQREAHVFRCQQGGADARGIYSPDGFVVLEGSLARARLTASGKPHLEHKRQVLVDAGILVEDDGRVRFTRDHAFNSPSAAGYMVTGTPVNGWAVWIDDRGRTLNDVYRTAAPDEDGPE